MVGYMYLLIAKLSDTIVLSPIDMSLSMKLVKGVILKDPPRIRYLGQTLINSFYCEKVVMMYSYVSTASKFFF